MATFHFDLVSPEKLAFSGEVDQVDVPGAEGDFGVLAGHAPIVAAIRPGILTISTGGTHQKIIVLGGLESVSGVALGAIVLAVLETFSTTIPFPWYHHGWNYYYLPPSYQPVIPFALLVVVLLLLPKGLASLFSRRWKVA